MDQSFGYHKENVNFKSGITCGFLEDPVKFRIVILGDHQSSSSDVCSHSEVAMSHDKDR